MKDEQLQILRLIKGDKKAFNTIYREYHQMLYYISIQYLRSHEDALEVVQEVFVKLWENRTDIRESAKLRNYLYTLTKNNCLDILKMRERRMRKNEEIRWVEMHFQYEAMLRFSFTPIEFDELKQKVDEAISNLPEHGRVVFRMSRFEGLKNKEIAEKLGVSEKTVEAHMTKSLKKLREELRWYLPILLFLNQNFL
ncbi:RNA polymerase sigma-70 factor [Carboxylicivirga taeanensis]|uniref:RNA polymerase sigma-70 factor n=1 Tax=Carboxylicivirga taeanensis TaxID=1416875 RepID=UPI003F6DD55C